MQICHNQLSICNVLCTDDQSCRLATINAKPHAFLNVTCTGNWNGENSDNTEACELITINGNTNTHMNVLCGASAACPFATIDGRDAAKLRIEDCASGTYTCYAITVWCPQNVNGDKKCIIQGHQMLFHSYLHIQTISFCNKLT